MLSWVHFGDLHASADDGYESIDHLQTMIGWVNRYLSDRIDFAFLPGDNANNGTPAQFSRIIDATRELAVPLYAIPGDHDFEPGNLDAFNAFAAEALPMSRVVKGHRCIFLDVVSAGRGGPDFRLSAADRQWLDDELVHSAEDGAPPIVFMHAYPGDVAGGESLAQAFARANVALVDTGHTHYNELLNDGWVVYASTRSTGQIEEDDGRPGLSVIAVDGGALSWKFRRVDADGPFVMITQPCDWRLHRRRAVLNATTVQPPVRVLVSGDDVAYVRATLNGVPFDLMPAPGEVGLWQSLLPAVASTRRMRLTVMATTADGRVGQDSIELPSGALAGDPPGQEGTLGTDVHAVQAWPEHGILGSQLGPNKHGHGW